MNSEIEKDDKVYQKPKLNADQELGLYLKKPTSFLDWVGIITLMLLTYGFTYLLLFIFMTWGANQTPTQDKNYRDCQIFNLVIFGAYILVLGILWRIFIGRRDQMKEELIQKKLKIQENL